MEVYWNDFYLDIKMYLNQFTHKLTQRTEGKNKNGVTHRKDP